MRKISKSVRYSLMISGFIIATTNHLEAATCPTLNRDQVRTLCRWDALKNLPLLKIEAKKVKIDEVTLQNKHDSCREKDSIKQFLTKNEKTTYVGKISKDFKAPNDHSQVLCIYTIDNEAFGFSAEGVPHPDAVAKKEEVHHETHPKKPRGVVGFDMTTGKMGEVAIREHEHEKKEPIHIQPQTPSQRPDQPVRPHPLPGSRALPQIPVTSGTGSTPPNYPPPKTPDEQTQGEKKRQPPPRPQRAIPQETQ